MSLGKFSFVSLSCSVCLIGFWKSHLFHSFEGWLARKAARSGLFQSGLQTDPHFGVDVDTEVEPGPQHRPEIWRW